MIDRIPILVTVLVLQFDNHMQSWTIVASFEPKGISRRQLWPCLFGHTSPSPPSMILKSIKTLLTINHSCSMQQSHSLLISFHLIMPTKRVPCWKDKQVLVSVYVEMPKRRPASITHHHHHHHHHYVHHTIKREATSHKKSAAAGGKGYASSRRAELLQYSQYLRQSAREASESSSSTAYAPNPSHTSNPKPQIVAIPKMPKNSKVPTCLGNCKIPTIFGPLLTSFQAKKERKAGKKGGNRVKAVIKSLKVQKQQAFLCNVFSSSAR